ncbi:nitrate reductase subunit alpha [Falsiroseomonas oryzae]|uniref:nitrate reductase subunit alpha n=1 Tax=Falsiroseomonas oryzae TaxID=2766473 RepID=UPI0022EADA6E|nr:nitrate reductase subunit alpha [Roseomonas sp. MO-31]
MSHFLDRLGFFRKAAEPYANGHGQVVDEPRGWEDAYRARWATDKVVRSTHGVNCTGSCSWKIHVKGGVVTWETQQTDYPRTRPGLPNHEPRGCARGASYSWYLYSANRVKHPMMRKRLLKLWRAARAEHADPVQAWASIQADGSKRREYQKVRGLGGFVRVTWEEAEELIAAANIHTAKAHGPDRVIGFSPIPAMSMVSYAAGSRYLSLIGGVCMSFYDWYCDLPPSSPQTWGEQTDVPESADWYNTGFLMMWGSNVPQTRTPDAHFMTEARYRGAKTVVVTPDYSEASKFADLWLHPKQGTDAALAMAMGHVILSEWHAQGKGDYFLDYCRRYTDMPMLVLLEEKDGRLVGGRQLRSSDLEGGLGETNNAEWKTVAVDEATGRLYAPTGSIGFRWGEQGKWNLEGRDARTLEVTTPRLSLMGEEEAEVAFPYFGARAPEFFNPTAHDEVIARRVPARRITLADGSTRLVATVYDLFLANYGVARDGSTDFDADAPYTPAWAAKVCGIRAADIVTTAREFAANADKTHGKSMVILGAAVNHWYHGDMIYRGIINLLVMCGCIGQSGGGWSHYVGQEKLRPQTGWVPLAFATDWSRPPRQMNSTSFFYAHTGQYRYEKLEIGELLSPTAPDSLKGSLIDFNVRAERMGWLPSAPQLQQNPLRLAAAAAEAGLEPAAYVAKGLKDGALRMSCEDPENPANWPRNLFIWRSNLLGSSGKGHEYFLKHLLGTSHGVQGRDLGDEGGQKPEEVTWRDAPEGKLDLLVTLDFRMSTTCVHSDIVLPTATWYEKHDLNTSDMHPFIHPLSAAVDPAWESRTDWAIFRGIAKRFSELAVGHLGVEKDVVLAPLMHDTAQELAQGCLDYNVRDWKRGECEPVPGRTMPAVAVVERDYPRTYARFTALGPLLEKLGNGGKGIGWKTAHEVEFLGRLNGEREVPGAGLRPKIESDIHAAEVILSLAPETNGHVAVKAWEALGKNTGRDHTHLAAGKEHEAIRFRDVQAQPRKIISSPTWSGIESEEVCYNAGYTNVHELIPWRTLTGRQQLYQDHPWMLAFGEALCVYKPPVDLKAHMAMVGAKPNGHAEIALNFITPHQKWGIHSTYSDNLIMLTLNRGGPVVWLSEVDARKAGIEDNDWIEAFNVNGALTARAVVSQRVPEGMVMMYHAQEKIVNTPGSEVMKTRGGIHNSVTRTTPKPTHMIGGYAQLSWGFNYHGTIGTNRDEFVVVRKMATVDWMDEPAAQAEETV